MKNSNHSQINHTIHQKRPTATKASFALSQPFTKVTSSFIPVTLAFGAGICWSKFANVPVYLCWIIVAVLATRVTINLRQQTRWTSPLMLLALFFIIGGIHSTLKNQLPTNPNHILNQSTPSLEASIVGKLTKSPLTVNGKTYFQVDAKQLIKADSTKIAVNGLVRLAMQEFTEINFHPGDFLIARAILSPVSSYGVPGAFDYKKYLNQQDIFVNGWVSSPLLLKKIAKPTVSETNLIDKTILIAENIRKSIGHFIDKSAPKQAGLYKSILIGDRSSLTNDQLEYFKSSGAIHLLAISGLHMGLLSLIFTICTTWILTRKQWIILNLPVTKTAAIMSLLPLTAYALIAGFQTPAIRALIMISVFILALITDRQWNILNNLAIAALLILAITPSLLFTASFQLSFAAVATIAIIPTNLSHFFLKPNQKSPIKTLYLTIKRWLFFSIITSFAAFIGTAPILLWHFNRVSLVSALSTLFIEPFLCLWALTLGLLAAMFVPWWEQAATAILKLGAIGIDISDTIARKMASLPFSTFWLTTPSTQEIIIYYLAVLFFLSLWHKKMRVAYMLLGTALVLFFVRPNYIPKDTIVSILDVGQGSATILQMPGNYIVLVDGGRKQKASSSFNIGENIIAPFLWNKKISKIDDIIITHPHADHYNGLPFIIEKFKPSRIWVNNPSSKEWKLAKIDRLASQNNIKLLAATPNQLIYMNDDKDIRLSILKKSDSKALYNSKQTTDSRQNNQGIAVSLTHGATRFLMTGDIEIEAEQDLLKNNSSFSLKSNVMTAPHHGSITSSSTDFIQAVKPQYITISASKYSKGRFPDPAVLARYKNIGATTINTADSGSIFFTTDGSSLKVSTYYHSIN